MDVLNKSMSGQVKINNSLKEDFVKILGYIASMSFLLMVFLSLVYIFMPEVSRDFVGIKVDFPHIDEVNGVLRFTVHSISNVFTYVFLSVVGIISFLGAQYIEDRIEREEEEEEEEEQEEEKKPAKPKGKVVEVVKSETIIKGAEPAQEIKQTKPVVEASIEVAEEVADTKTKIETVDNLNLTSPDKPTTAKTVPLKSDKAKSIGKLEEEDEKFINLGKSLREISKKRRGQDQ
ncbi:MAG: hypothetical protein K8T10_09385 [Candidatus Eremiobacteraeota bacterium]|nr:hypothetical protein [Candidatus Eremiobacteraeota bacterium]